jgi:hypothetical protein
MDVRPLHDSAPTEEEPDLNDRSFFRLLAIGFAVGIPAFFGLALLAIAITSYWEVTPALIWTAVVAGPYIGGFLAVNIALARREAAERHPAQSAAGKKDRAHHGRTAALGH